MGAVNGPNRRDTRSRLLQQHPSTTKEADIVGEKCTSVGQRATPITSSPAKARNEHAGTSATFEVLSTNDTRDFDRTPTHQDR